MRKREGKREGKKRGKKKGKKKGKKRACMKNRGTKRHTGKVKKKSAGLEVNGGTKTVSRALTRTLGLRALGTFLLCWNGGWTLWRTGALGPGFGPPVLLPLPVVLPLESFNPSKKQDVLRTSDTKYLKPQKPPCTFPSLSCSAPLPLPFSWTSPKVSCQMRNTHLRNLSKQG